MSFGVWLIFGGLFSAARGEETNTVPFTHLLSVPPPGKFDPIKSYEKITKTPIFWDLEVIGADLAKEAVAGLNLKPVTVVVSDAGVTLTSRKIAYALPPARNMMDLLVGTRMDAGPQQEDWIDALENAYSIIGLGNTKSKTHGDTVSRLIGVNNDKFGVGALVEIEDLNVFGDANGTSSANLNAAYKVLISREEPTPILNISHGFGLSAKVAATLKNLIKTKDTVCVVAAHNQGIELSEGKVISKLDECIVTGSIGLSGIRSDFSNYGKPIKLVAPGELIYAIQEETVADPTPLYQMIAGTSFSAPLVSGAAANLRALLPFANAAQIREILYKSAIDLGLEGKDDSTGYGLLNIVKATRVAQKVLGEGVHRSDEFQNVLQDPKTFDLMDLSNEALTAAAEAGTTSPEYLKLLRESVLLDGRAESFSKLADAYDETKYVNFARGLKIIGLNRPTQKISSKDLERIGSFLADLQKLHLITKETNFYIIQSIANEELLADLKTRLKDVMTDPLSKVFDKQEKLIQDAFASTENIVSAKTL